MCSIDIVDVDVYGVRGGEGYFVCCWYLQKKTSRHVTFFYQKLFLKNVIAGLFAAIEFFFYSAHCENR